MAEEEKQRQLQLVGMELADEMKDLANSVAFHMLEELANDSVIPQS